MSNNEVTSRNLNGFYKKDEQVDDKMFTLS